MSCRPASAVSHLVPGVPAGMVGQLVRFGIIGVGKHIGLFGAVSAPAFDDGCASCQPDGLAADGHCEHGREPAFTFGIRGRTGVARHQLNGLLVFAFGLAITSGSLFALHRFDPTVSKEFELSVLVAANLVATLVRFIALRRVFGAHRR